MRASRGVPAQSRSGPQKGGDRRGGWELPRDPGRLLCGDVAGEGALPPRGGARPGQRLGRCLGGFPAGLRPERRHHATACTGVLGRPHGRAPRGDGCRDPAHAGAGLVQARDDAAKVEVCRGGDGLHLQGCLGVGDALLPSLLGQDDCPAALFSARQEHHRAAPPGGAWHQQRSLLRGGSAVRAGGVQAVARGGMASVRGGPDHRLGQAALLAAVQWWRRRRAAPCRARRPAPPSARRPAAHVARRPAASLGRRPAAPLGRWPAGPGPLGRWPGGPLGREPAGPLGQRPGGPLGRQRQPAGPLGRWPGGPLG
mmetsp:Transcript_53750/g.149108  ORF Transcript_53750/g.149108 Transcript_53750/m.149108 type:complete len:312 (-) Transcript_53750:293-1228(-)